MICPSCGTRLPSSGRAGRRVVIGAAVVAALAAVVIAVVLVIGAGTANNVKSAIVPNPGRPSGYGGPPYPGMLTQDHVAGPSGVVTHIGEAVAAARLRRVASLIGATMCADVSVANNSQQTRSVGPAEWKLQAPNGTVETFGLTGALASGEIAPGGRAAGTVCFADSGQSGGFVLVWQPLALTAGRGIWLFRL